MLKEKVDLLIADIMMPGMNGIDLCKNLKSNILTSHVPIILITASTGIETEMNALKSGAQAYIAKPFYVEQIQMIIKNTLKDRKKLQEYLSSQIPDTSTKMDLNPLDHKFLEKVNNVIQNQMDNSGFTVDDLGNELNMSRMHLYRKLKALTGLSPTEFIRKIRLDKSIELLSEGKSNIAEISYMTGFSSPASFSATFRKYKGKSPISYKKEKFRSR